MTKVKMLKIVYKASNHTIYCLGAAKMQDTDLGRFLNAKLPNRS